MKLHRVLAVFLACCFVFLCSLHYFSARPLWLDENLLLDNIKPLDYQGVLGPLKNSQAFPRLYLLAVKYIAGRFNYHALALRFLPVLSMLAAFFIWAKAYRKTFARDGQYSMAVFSFTGSYYLSYYAAEFKHYSMDVLAIGIFLLYLFYQRQVIDKKPAKLFIVATALLPLTLFFSYSGFFAFWIVIYNFLFSLKKNPRLLPLLLIYALSCAVFIILVFTWDLRHTLSTPALFSYWKDYFLCADSPYCFMKSFGEGLRRLVVWWFGNGDFFRKAASFLIPFFVFPLFGYGIKSLRKEKFKIWDIEALGLVIFLELFILGLIKKYPFTGERITLFFAPFVFCFIVKGIGFFRVNKPLYYGLNIFYIIFLVACALNSLAGYLKLYL